MKVPATPRNEHHRQDALDGLHIIDTPPEQDFDILVGLGHALFNVPISLVSLVDNERQWFKACVGLDVKETPRDISFCGHAILKDDVFVVLDARKDKRFHDNPLVTGKPKIRFYAGAPIRLPTGYRIGTFCIMGPEPRKAFDEGQREQLRALATLTLNAFRVRALRDAVDDCVTSSMRYRAILHALPVPVALVNAQGLIEDANDGFAGLCAKRPLGKMIAEALPIGKKTWSPSLMSKRDLDAMEIDVPVAAHGKGGGKTGRQAKQTTTLRVLRDAAGYVFVAG